MVGLLIGTVVFALIFAVAFVPLAYRAIKVIPEFDRLVVFRLGRAIGPKGPGLVWLWPILDRAVTVDLREQVLAVLHQTTITKDNGPISIDFLVYSRIVNPVESVVQVADFARASQEFDADQAAWEVASNRLPDVPRSSVEMRDSSVPPTAIRHAEVLVSALLSRMVS